MFDSNGGTRPITLAGIAATEVAIDRFTVTVEAGPDAGHSATLSSTSLRMGTDSENDLVLTDPTVSKQHALLTLTTSGIQIEDLESRNGSMVDGTRVRVAYLRPGALVTLGNTTLRVESAATRLVVSPAPERDFEGIVAQSEAMRKVFGLIRQLAKTDLPVTITGETGTGKELVARALHRAGPRRDKNFLVLDCGSILSELLRSELFGHEKGAFTGAEKTTKGILEEAAGGTVFLDEVGEIDLAVQPNLLRALETREVTRIGSRKPVPVDFRIVSATNRNLKKRAEEGTFREDLYYRLSCVTIRLPPLRERRVDLPLVAAHFLSQCAHRHGGPTPPLAADALELLSAYDWPGNLRELRNVMEAVWAMSEGRAITATHIQEALPEPEDNEPFDPRSGNESLKNAERSVIEKALHETNWNRKEAARRLGISHTTMFKRIKQFDLKPPDSKD